MAYPSWILVIQKLCVGALNCLFRFFGLSLVPTQNLLLMYQHDYGVGGYEKYKRIQIFHNKRKIDQVWADEDTIKIIATYIGDHIGGVIRSGICHCTVLSNRSAVSDISVPNTGHPSCLENSNCS